MENQIIDVSLDYKEEVLADFFKFQINIRQKTKWLFILAALVAAGAGAVLWFVIKIPAVGIACMVIGLVIIVNYPLQMRRAIKRQNFRALSRPNQRLKISDECLIQYDLKNQVAYDWERIIEACETKYYFYLYSSKYGALIVQKKELTEATLSFLREIITSKNIKIKKYLYHK